MRRASAGVGLMIIVTTGMVWGQSVRSLVNGGNDLYEEKKFGDAEVNYRKALEKEPASLEGHFNLGNALYKQGKTDESLKEFENSTLRTDDTQTRADAYYNIGNSHLQAQQYQEAVQSYVEALKLNPNDMDAKYNLSYALEMLKHPQQNKSDKNKDNKNDKNKNDQQKQDQQQNQDNKNQQQQKKDQPRQQQPQQGRQMSRADAERILDVLKNNEKDVQKKLRVRRATRPRGEKDW